MYPVQSTMFAVPFLDSLPGAERARLLGASRTVSVGAGEALFKRGDPGGDLFVVLSGSLVAVDTRSVPETVLANVSTGDVVGEMTFLDCGPRTADVRARGEARVAHWARGVLLDLLRSDSGLAAVFYRALCETLISHARNVTTSAIVGAYTSPSPFHGQGAVTADADPAPIERALLAAVAAATGAQTEDARFATISGACRPPHPTVPVAA